VVARKAKVEAERMAKEAGLKLAKKIAMWKEVVPRAMEDGTQAAIFKVDAAQKAYDEAKWKEKQLDKEMAGKTAQSIVIKKVLQKRAEAAKAKVEYARRALKDTKTDEQAMALKDSMMAAQKELKEVQRTAQNKRRQMVKEMDELTAGRLKVEAMVRDAKAWLAAARRAVWEAREKPGATAKAETWRLKAEQKALEEQVKAAKVRLKAAHEAFEAAKQRARGKGK